MKKTITTTTKVADQRLDIFCVSQLIGHSRVRIQRAIRAGSIQVNDTTVKPRYALKADDVITVDLPTKTTTVAAPPQSITIPAIYEDEDIVVIDKPAGIAAHPGTGMSGPTIASWFAEHYPESRSVGENATRAGIVHRLDKDTSGLMVLAKTADAYSYLKQQFKRRRVHKEYLALVFGVPKADNGRITRPLKRSKRNPLRRTIDRLGKEKPGGGPASLRGKPAATEWQTEQAFTNRYALIRAFPHTGRTHQIRVHLHFLGHPIVGDALYTFKRRHLPQGVTRQLLHAEKLTLNLLGGKRKTFTAPLADDFKHVLENLQQS